jgi:chitinase
MRLHVLLLFAVCAGVYASYLSNEPVGYDKVVMCYFGSWSVYRHSNGKFDVEDIPPFACTHLVYGFAGLNPSNYTIMSLDPYNELYDDYGRGAFKRFTGLKKHNPNLVTLLAIGGWNEGKEDEYISL